MSIGQDLLNVPFPEMVKSMGVGIAQAQYELDLTSMKIARLMGGYDIEEDENGNSSTTGERTNLVKIGPKDDDEYSLLELGFTPTFYQFVDTLIEVKMSISMSRETTRVKKIKSGQVNMSGKLGFFSAKASVNASSVSASFSSKYQYSAEGSSLMRTKLVTVPPPPMLEERIRQILDRDVKPVIKPDGEA